jgi:hypothetical protein
MTQWRNNRLKTRAIHLITLAALLFIIGGAVAYASVSLSRFEGQWNASGTAVLLQWETGSETNHLRFNLWRSTENLPISASGQIDTSRAIKVEEFPPSQAACSSAGHQYPIYTDDTVDPNVDTYYYYLESVNCTTGSEFEGAATGGGLEVTKGDTRETYLPLIWRQ